MVRCWKKIGFRVQKLSSRFNQTFGLRSKPLLVIFIKIQKIQKRGGNNFTFLGITPCRNCLDYALLTVGSWPGNSRVTFTQPGPGRALPAQLFGKFSPTRACSDYGHTICFTVSARALNGTRPGRLLVSKFAFL